MSPENIQRAEQEAERFLAAVRAWRGAVTIETRHGYEIATNAPRESGAMRRASMDLTRALADMRKP
jgi:hypothetical protein